METKSSADLDKPKRHPQEESNIFSDLFFCWTIPTFRTGFKKELCEKDIYQTLEHHDSNRLANRLEIAWNSQQSRLHMKQSLSKAIWTVFKWEIIASTILYIIREFLLKICRPLALGKLMGFYAPHQTGVSKNDAIIYASVIIIASFVDAVIGHAWIMYFQQLGMKVRIAVSSLIYRKSFKLSRIALRETTVGHIVNLLSNDMRHLELLWGAVNVVWSCPLQATIIIYLLYHISGVTALAGVAFIFILTPIQLLMSKKSAYYRLRIALKTDERIRHMNEIISGIQIIKVYDWVQPFIKLIDSIRRKEVHFVKIDNYLNALRISFSFFVDKTAIFLCTLTYVLTGNTLNAQYVYVLSSFYATLMDTISIYLPESVSQILQGNVSITRSENLLNLDEIQNELLISSQIGLKIEKASAKWSKISTHSTLRDINFEIQPGQLIAIIGPIGSGKSSLLHLCLNEMSLVKGLVEIGGRVSYADQEPWLFSGTIKQNILFGQTMITNKYKEVIKVCALEEDIAQLPCGDGTIVGERGVRLSGGQKARINLARAVYKEADIYLLDDPLSAVDAGVGKKIFNSCIKGYLKDKCTVLVTHQVQYLNHVDTIFLMINGTIAMAGSYKEMQMSGEDFTKLLSHSENFEKEEVSLDESETSHKNNKEEVGEEEYRIHGKVSNKLYGTYMRAAGSYVNFFLIALLFILTESFATGANYYVTFWVNLEHRKAIDNITASSEDTFLTNEHCIYIYVCIISFLIILSTVRSVSFIRSCMLASIHLHNKMFTSVVNATMRFFYTNSSGRILNRFSRDIGNLDETLPYTLMDVLQLSLAVIGTVLAICIVSPWTLIPTCIISLIMYFIRAVFLASSRSIKRIESTNRSPIFAHLTQSMRGLTTIRAFGVGEMLKKEFDNLQNVHTSAYYMFLATSRAFALWLDSICVIYVLIITTIALTREIYGGNVGFIITQGMSLTGMFQRGIRRWSDLENEMVSVERVAEYVELETESDKKTNEPSPRWPEYGKIEFKSISMQHSTKDPYVLKDLNFIIKPREKIGIVGRTGAGKSSLITVLFRLVNFEGAVLIDDVNTKEISLSSLRSKISIIPQEPVLFSGSVRKNLDPFDRYLDDEIWNVLDEVKLKKMISELPLGLESNLLEGGSNFSVGQKQLICLARALLKNNKILILDEATANVDPYTDELLQQTIRRRFEMCTVLTIAHRLHTIMDSDKVLVINNGCVVEFEHPLVLLEKKGFFYSLVMETGHKVFQNLVQIARKNFETRLVTKL